MKSHDDAVAVDDDDDGVGGSCGVDDGDGGDDDVCSHLEKWLDIKLYHVTVSFNR